MLAKKDYAEAEKFWSQQIDIIKGNAFWHNLAVIYKLQSKIPQARHAFEMAKYNSIYSQETHKELEAMIEMLPASSSNKDYFNPSELLVDLGPAKVWVIAVLTSVSIIAFIKKNQPYWLNVLMGILSLGPVLGAFILFQTTIAFVNFEKVPIFNGASQLFDSGKYLPAGSRIVGIPKDDWISIYSSSGETFWVRKKDLEGQIGLLWE